MNEIRLKKPTGESVDAFMCQRCGMIYREPDGRLARSCCQCYVCKQPLNCAGQHAHDECRHLQSRLANAQRLAHAETVSEYEGYLYSDEVSGYRDGYFRDMEDLFSFCDDSDVDPPAFVFACTPTPPQLIDIDDFIDRAESDGPEEAWEHLNGTDEIEAALKAFREANADVKFWEPDYSRKVKVAR